MHVRILLILLIIYQILQEFTHAVTLSFKGVGTARAVAVFLLQ